LRDIGLVKSQGYGHGRSERCGNKNDGR
jgi:hypothetical protein